jgi:hypothetical protein
MVVKKYFLVLLAGLSLFAILLAPMGASAQGNSGVARDCQQGGYVNWTVREGGPPFTSMAECVSVAAQGKLYPAHYAAPTLTIERAGVSDVYGDVNGTNITRCRYLVTYNNFLVHDPTNYEIQTFNVTFYHDGIQESVGNYIIENGVSTVDIVPFGVTQVIVVTDRLTGEVLVTGTPQVCEVQP